MGRPTSSPAPAATIAVVAALVATVASLALAPAVAAQRIVPPGNSAVNQYTETYPTAKGEAPASEKGKRTPAESLGTDNARELERLGPEGQAAAELAAATAPASGGPNGGTAGGTGGTGGTDGAGGDAADEPDATSRIDAILSQATGTSSGELGPLLPLAILAAVVGSAAYLWRRRRTAD